MVGRLETAFSGPTSDPYASLGRWLAAIDSLHTVLHRFLWRKIARTLEASHCRRVLDIGCGTGGLAVYLERHGFEVVGVDSSVTMLRRARLRDTAVDWVLGDAAELPFRQEFDAVVIAFALHEMVPEVRSQVWGSVRAVIRSGGTILVADYNRPAQQSLWARLIFHLIEADERLFLKLHPPHYRNFREWIDNGGLSVWLYDLEAPVKLTARLMGGTISLAELQSKTSL